MAGSHWRRSTARAAPDSVDTAIPLPEDRWQSKPSADVRIERMDAGAVAKSSEKGSDLREDDDD
jgi:hypothetical protein